MTKRHLSGYRHIVAAGALVVAVLGVSSPALADDPPADDSVEQPAEPAGEPTADAPDTGEVDGAVVAVGAPPVPAPVVAVGQPPVPSVPPVVAVGTPPVPVRAPQASPVAEHAAPAGSDALVDTASAVLDLIADLL